MTLRVAINGFGRIGRNFMRCWLSRGAYTNIEVVGINVTSDPKTNAHLLKYDSVLGQLDGVDIQYTDDTFVINNKTIKCFSDRNPMNLPWKDWGVDLVIESTGVFNTDVGASKHRLYKLVTASIDSSGVLTLTQAFAGDLGRNITYTNAGGGNAIFTVSDFNNGANLIN